MSTWIWSRYLFCWLLLVPLIPRLSRRSRPRHKTIQVTIEHTSGPACPAILTETDRVDLGLADTEAVEEIGEQISTDQLDVDATVASETAVHSMDSARADDAVFAHSNAAACAIQAMYRRHVLRRESGVRKLSEARSRFFIDCGVESEKTEWPHRH